MTGRRLTPAEREQIYNMTIWRAIKCAGGFSAVARELEVSEATPRVWAKLPGHVPKEHRQAICDMGGNAFRPEQLTTREEACA